jgi:branched-chain amino acid transport system permease protein
LRKAWLRNYIGNLVGVAVLAAVFAPLPFMVDEALSYVLGMAFLFVLLAISWDLVTGYTGVVNLGLTVFVGLGGYTSGLLQEAGRLKGTELAFISELTGLPVYATILIGGLVAAAVGLAIGVATLRLKGWYFALVTAILPLVFVQTTYVWKDVFGGEEGFVVHASLGTTVVEKYYAALAMLLLCLVCVLAVTASRVGMRWKAVRDDEVLAEALGFSTTRYRVAAFVLSSFIAGVAGAATVHYRLVANNDLYDVPLLLLVILAVVVGGAGTVWGPVAGGFIVFSVKNWWLKPLVYGYIWPAGIPLNDDMILYAALIAIAILRPHGLWGSLVKIPKAFSHRFNRGPLHPKMPLSRAGR